MQRSGKRSSLRSRRSKFEPFFKYYCFPSLACFFRCYFSCHISNLNLRKNTFSNANSYFTFTSLNCPHSLQNGLTDKAGIHYCLVTITVTGGQHSRLHVSSVVCDHQKRGFIQKRWRLILTATSTSGRVTDRPQHVSKMLCH